MRESVAVPSGLKSGERRDRVCVCVSPTGSRPSPAQEVTPTGVRLLKPASPHNVQKAQRLQSPSPAILNFTLQNLGLISGSSPGNGYAASHTPDRLHTLASPLALHQRGMVFVKPVSPLPLQTSVPGQQVALISVQQVKQTNRVYVTQTESCLEFSLATRGRHFYTQTVANTIALYRSSHHQHHHHVPETLFTITVLKARLNLQHHATAAEQGWPPTAAAVLRCNSRGQ